MAQQTTSTSVPPPAGRRRGLPRGLPLWVGAAFLIGLAISAVVLMRDDGNEFYRADAPANEDARPGYAPLPAPLPAGSDDTLVMHRPAPPDPEAPRVVETRPAPPPAPAARREAPRAAAIEQPRPIPGQTPAPRYPAQALRRGEQGTVLVRAEIGPDGVPTSVSLAAGSGSRQLDRAALDAVRRWRFSPATDAGRPTVGSVVVPIEFTRN